MRSTVPGNLPNNVSHNLLGSTGYSVGSRGWASPGSVPAGAQPPSSMPRVGIYLHYLVWNAEAFWKTDDAAARCFQIEFCHASQARQAADHDPRPSF